MTTKGRFHQPSYLSHAADALQCSAPPTTACGEVIVFDGGLTVLVDSGRSLCFTCAGNGSVEWTINHSPVDSSDGEKLPNETLIIYDPGCVFTAAGVTVSCRRDGGQTMSTTVFLKGE